MSTSIFVPDPFITWLMRWSLRALALCAAIGIIAFVASIVFRAVALMVDTLHEALRSVFILCTSFVQVYDQLNVFGQWFVLCGTIAILLMIIYRGIRFLVSTHGGTHS